MEAMRARLLVFALAACALEVLAGADCSVPRRFVYDLPHHLRRPLPPPDFELTFFLQDRLITPTNRTSYPVTLPVLADAQNLTLRDQSYLKNPSASLFGTIVVFDDSMTEGVLPNSTEVGRGRGMYVFDLQNDFGPVKGLEYVFTAIFNEQSGFGNSTLCFKGWQLTYEDARPSQLAICGGTGVFATARGYADIATQFIAIDASLAALKVTSSLYF